MLDPVDHINYYFEKGKGWVPEVIRIAQLRQAAKPINFGYPIRYTYGDVIINYRGLTYMDDI